MTLYDLRGRDLISTQEWTVEELKESLEFAKQLKKIRLAKPKGEKLRKSITKVAKERHKKLSRQMQATKYF